MNCVVAYVGLHNLVDDSRVPTCRSEPRSATRLLVGPATGTRAVREEQRESDRRRVEEPPPSQLEVPVDQSMRPRAVHRETGHVGWLPSATARKTCVLIVCHARRRGQKRVRRAVIGEHAQTVMRDELIANPDSPRTRRGSRSIREIVENSRHGHMDIRACCCRTRRRQCVHCRAPRPRQRCGRLRDAR
jgi:hypothetical protein